MVGTNGSYPRAGKVRIYGLAAFTVKARAMLTERPIAGSLPKVIRFDVVAFGTERVVVIHVMRVGLNGVPRGFAGHICCPPFFGMLGGQGNRTPLR